MKQQGNIRLLLFIMCIGGIIHQTTATSYKNISTDSLWHQVKKHHQSSPDLALEYAAALQKEAKNNNNKAQEANALWAIGLINKKQGNYNKGIEAYFKVLPIYKELGDTKNVAITYYNIAKIFTDTKNDLAAKDFYLNALRLYTSLDYKSGITKTNLQLGLTYVNLKQPLKAATHLNIALKLASIDHQKIIHKIYNLLGMLATDKGNYEEAIALFNTSLAHSEQESDLSEKAIALLNIGVVYSKNGNVAAAKEYAQKSLALSTQINDVDKQIKPQILLAEIAAAQRGKNGKEVTDLMATVRKFENNNYNAYLQEALYYVSEKPQQDIIAIEDLKEMMRVQAKQSKVSSDLYEKTKKLLNQHSIQLSIEKVQHEQKAAALKEKNNLLWWSGVVVLTLFLFIIIGYAQYVKHKNRLKEKEHLAALKQSEIQIEIIKNAKKSIFEELTEHVDKNVFLVGETKKLQEDIEQFGDEYEKLTNQLSHSNNTMREMSKYVWNMIKEVSRQGFKIPAPPPWDLGSERDN